MDRSDKEIRDQMKGVFNDCSLSSIQKQRLRQAAFEQLEWRRVWWPKRVAAAIKEFREATFEINLTPVAAVVVAMFVAAGAIGYGWEPGVADSGNRVVYVQQVVTGPDGSTNVIYLAVKDVVGR